MSKEAEKEAAKAAKEAEKEAAKAPADDFAIADPLEIRPKELPLIVTPPKGGWKSKAQEKFAGIMSAYAYKNPEKFAKKKAALAERLRSLENAPDPVEDPNIKFRNNAISQNG